MMHEFKTSIEFSTTDSSLLVDSLAEKGEDLSSFAARVLGHEAHRLVNMRKREIGQIIAMKGEIDEQVRVESVKLAEARRSPW